MVAPSAQKTDTHNQPLINQTFSVFDYIQYDQKIYQELEHQKKSGIPIVTREWFNRVFKRFQKTFKHLPLTNNIDDTCFYYHGKRFPFDFAKGRALRDPIFGSSLALRFLLTSDYREEGWELISTLMRKHGKTSTILSVSTFFHDKFSHAEDKYRRYCNLQQQAEQKHDNLPQIHGDILNNQMEVLWDYPNFYRASPKDRYAHMLRTYAHAAELGSYVAILNIIDYAAMVNHDYPLALSMLDNIVPYFQKVARTADIPKSGTLKLIPHYGFQILKTIEKIRIHFYYLRDRAIEKTDNIQKVYIPAFANLIQEANKYWDWFFNPELLLLYCAMVFEHEGTKSVYWQQAENYMRFLAQRGNLLTLEYQDSTEQNRKTIRHKILRLPSEEASNIILFPRIPGITLEKQQTSLNTEASVPMSSEVPTPSQLPQHNESIVEVERPTETTDQQVGEAMLEEFEAVFQEKEKLHSENQQLREANQHLQEKLQQLKKELEAYRNPHLPIEPPPKSQVKKWQPYYREKGWTKMEDTDREVIIYFEQVPIYETWTWKDYRDAGLVNRTTALEGYDYELRHKLQGALKRTKSTTLAKYLNSNAELRSKIKSALNH